MDYGPDERELFESAATALFDDLVSSGGLADDDARFKARGPDRPALDLLLELGLVIHDKSGKRYVGVDPSTVQSRVVSPMSTEGSRLLTESASWAAAFLPLQQTWRRAPSDATSGPFTHVHGGAIDGYLAALVAECEDEILTAQPQVGRTAEALEAAAKRDTLALERGVKMRTLYQHSARRSSVTHKYVAAVSERGAEVRTLDEFFNRMIVFDHRVAIIPGKQEDLHTAIAIREPSVVDYLVDVFERAWERARPFTNTESSMMKDIAFEQRAMTIRMLIEGHSDPVSAKRLGVSPRTYAGYIADLKEEYGAETRFQLGYTMGQQGISGDERPEDRSDG